jgi:hypothetical protein
MMRGGLFLPRLIVLCCLPLSNAVAQDFGIDPNREVQLQASTKQVNQFFRRFNAEEAPDGKRWFSDHPDYHSVGIRKRYIPLLFDKGAGIPDSLVRAFTNEAVNGKQFLSLHGGAFLAEVHSVFSWEGKLDTLQLFLSIQEESVGSKWVMVAAKGMSILTVGQKDSSLVFLHPLSHEIEFMNLFRVFQDAENMHAYVKEDFEPDGLSVLWYEIQRKRVVFKSVIGVKFHFRQIEGWYFTLEQKLRSEINSGWLITGLQRSLESNKNSIPHD